MANGMPQRIAAAKYNIPKTTLQQRLVGWSKYPRKIGRKTELLRGEEMAIAQNLAALGDFGLAFDIQNIKSFIQDHLNRQERIDKKFKDNLPGTDWVNGFLNRHNSLLSKRICQNISHKRAAVSEENVNIQPGQSVTLADLAVNEGASGSGMQSKRPTGKMSMDGL
jgi:hypothetical protein